MKDTWRSRTKSRMRELAVTQDELKNVFGVKTRGAVGHYLTGRRTPSPEQLVALGRSLRMSMDELLLGAPPSSQPPRPADESIDRAIELLNLIGAARPDDRRFSPLRWNTISMVAQVLEKRSASVDQRQVIAEILATLE